MSGILRDIRYSARKFLRTPGLSLALLLTIALGIGSNVSIHGFVRGVTGSDSPLTSVDRVVSLFGRDAHREAGPLSYQDYLALHSYLNLFEWIGAARISPGAFTLADRSAIVSVAAVSPDLAGLFNLSLDKGVVISYRMWQREFPAKADVRGEQIRVEGVNMHVGGVAPRWLEGLYRDRAVDLWVPLQEDGLQGMDRNSPKLWVFARLRQNISINQAQVGVRSTRPGSGELRVLPYTGMTPAMSAGIGHVGKLLDFAGGLILFIACANVGSFLLGRASARARDTSLRVALGANCGQLVRELLSDSVVISVMGGASGLLLAVWTSRILPALLFEEDAERLVFAPDLFSIVAASAVCVGITIACGLLPVFVISHDRPATVLQREGAGPSKAIRRLRVGLVIAQMTSCCVLVISTATLLQGFRTALQTSVGHRLGHPILASMQARPDFGIQYFRDVQQVTKLMSGVAPMAWAGRIPGGLPVWQSFRIDSQQLPLRDVRMDSAAFTADSLSLFTLPPVAGRLFGSPDRTCGVAVANEAAAKALFGAETVGRSIRDTAGFPVEIIGVLALRKGKHASPTIYYYYADRTGPPPVRIASAQFRAPTRSELERADLDTNVVSPGYFAAMGLSLVAGRIFPDDTTLRGCRVGVINQAASDLYFNGKGIGAAVIDDSGLRTEIIGVVHSAPLGTFQQRVEPAIYFPMVQDCLPHMTLILGARAVNDPLLRDLRSRIESVPGRGPDPLVVKTLETYLSQTALAPLRIATMIIGASAATALILSILGLVGALSDAARQRQRELAVRIALGAQRWNVIYEVLKEGARLACAGTLAGTLGSLLLSRILARITTSTASPVFWVWLVAPLMLAGVVTIASVLPARRALLVNPLVIMRNEN